MENQIEKILCIEVLEKISRMRRYLFSHSSSSFKEGKEIISIFSSALNATQNNLESIIKYLKNSGALNPFEKATISRRISNAFFTIIKLHEQLQLIYGKWVRPETHTFIKEILVFFPSERKNKKINIILTNDYMFFESNLTWIFSDILNNTNSLSHIAEENPTVFLPKIDYDNPLNWTILAHECGHTDLRGIDKLLANPKLIPSGITVKNKIVLENWIEEIYCDLIATKVLGPAYLASFSTFVLLLSGIEGNETSSDTHPSNVLRINLIQEYLESKNIEIPLNTSYLGKSDLSSYYYFMLENYNETSRKFLNPSTSHTSFSLDMTLLLDTISEEVDDLIDLEVTLSPEDFRRINSLKERLDNGIPIASYHDIDKLEAVKSKYLIKSKFQGGFNELSEAKDALQETRTKLWEIINTGWIHKIEKIIPTAIELFFDNDNHSFKEKMDIFGSVLEKNDNILLKSIESSEIFKIMEGE